MPTFFARRASFLGITIISLLGCRSTSQSRGASDAPASTAAAASSTRLDSPRPEQNANPRRFASYEEAMTEVRRTYDCEVLEVSRSSVVYGAEYCDAGRAQGYLIVNLRGREYIHAGVPEGIWEEFRDAESMGSYYSSNLRGQYRLALAR